MLDVRSAQDLVDAAGLDFVVDTCTPMHGGGNSAVFDLSDRSDGTHLVAKVYSEALAWKMGKEVLVYGHLAAVAVPTPTILFADTSHQVVPADCALMTKVEGRRASTVTGTAGAADIRAIFRQIGQAARLCHTVGFDRFGYIGPGGLVDPEESNERFMSRLFDRHLATFRDHGGDPGVAAAVERRLAVDGRLFANCRRAVLCHDDLHEENVLVERRHGRWVVTGILDVENAVAADPLLDLAKTDYYAKGDPLRRRSLLEGYGPLPDDGDARLALYRLHHALSLWCWFATIGRTGPLPSITGDVRRFAGAAPSG